MTSRFRSAFSTSSIGCILVVCLLALAGPAVAQPPGGLMGIGHEPARPLSGRGLDNLVAFSRLLGYVRFFHPSDQAAAASWDPVAIAGVQAIESAPDAAALARTLEDFFRPLAPTVRVFPTGGPQPALPAELTAPEGAPRPKVTAWKHHGVDLGSPIAQGVYSSRRITDPPAPPQGFANLMQDLDATPFRGKTVRLKAAVRAEVAGEGRGQLWLRVDREKNEREFFDNMGDRPIRSGEWRSYEITGEVAPDATAIVFGLLMFPEGKVWVDDVSLEIVGAEGRNHLINPDFEKDAPGTAPKGWVRPRDPFREGIKVAVVEDRPASGKRAVLLSHEPPPADLPDPGQPFLADLGGGVSAMIPLALYADEGGTLPHAPSGVQPPAPARPEGFVPSGNDRATRLAAVAQAWNVFQHFYPYFDVVPTDWPEALRAALRAAATDADETAFLGTLRRLVAGLHDGHGQVSSKTAGARPHRLPLGWDWIEDRLVVTLVAADQTGDVKPGDVVTRIDGRPVPEALAAEEALISGATPQWRRWTAVRNLLMGSSSETEVRLDLEREGRPVSATLRRLVPRPGKPLQEPRLEEIAEIRPGIFYVDLARIDEADFAGAVERLAQAKGLIFDLRGYPRISTRPLAHLTDKTLTSARWNVPIVTRPDRQGMEFEFANWDVEPREPRFRARTAFLTDGRAISYAETYMGIVEHYKLAEIVGGPTAGTNGNINPFTLPGGYQIAWTGMKVLKQDGSRHHGVGIQPTVPVSRTIRGVAEGRDEVLEKAIEIVSR